LIYQGLRAVFFEIFLIKCVCGGGFAAKIFCGTVVRAMVGCGLKGEFEPRNAPILHGDFCFLKWGLNACEICGDELGVHGHGGRMPPPQIGKRRIEKSRIS
jgi:hypothetical protein